MAHTLRTFLVALKRRLKMEPNDQKFCAFQHWDRKKKYGICGSSSMGSVGSPCQPELCPLFDISNRMQKRFNRLFGNDELTVNQEQ
jgi:hypothetical protein